VKNLLLLSSSRVKDTGYLEHAKYMIKEHLIDVNNTPIKTLLFIPYAGVSVTYDDYTKMVQNALSDLNISVVGIHEYDDPKLAVLSADAIAVGGGNTFHLLSELYKYDLISDINHVCEKGTPYIGWSAGSNVAGGSIRTTNDMPIIEPPSFTALSLVSFQLNPHYTDYNPPGHNGETRAQRISEFMVLNKNMPIIAIVEGSALKVKGSHLSLISNVRSEVTQTKGYLFKGGQKSVITSDDNLDYLLD